MNHSWNFSRRPGVIFLVGLLTIWLGMTGANASINLLVVLPGQAFTSGTGVTGTASTATAGTAFSVRLVAESSTNNTAVVSFTGVKTISYAGPASAPGGATPTYTTSVTFASGQVAAVSTTLVDAQSTTITPTISGTTGVASSSLTVNPAAANKLVMKTEPSTPVVAGAVFGTQPAVSVEDIYGNVVTSDTSTVTATVGTGTGPLTGTLTKAAASGVATFSGLAAPTLAQTGLQLTFTDGSLTSAVDATSITVNSIGTPVSISQTSSTTSGKTVAIAVGAAVATGNTIIVTVSYAAQTPGAITVTDTKGNTYTEDGNSANAITPYINTCIFSAHVTTALASGNTITVTFVNNVTDKDANAFYVSGLLTSSPADQTSSTINNSGTTAANSGNTATTTQPVEILVGAIGMTTPPTTTTAGTGYTSSGTYLHPAGVGLLSEYDKVTATGTYSASGTLGTSEPWSATIVTYQATPGAASQLVMNTEPSTPAAAGAAFGTQPVVFVEDAFGDVVTSDSSTVTATVGTGTGPLTGTVTAVASSGVATFSGLAAPTLAQTGLQLTFTDGSLTSAVDATSITVNAGTAAKLAVTTEPSTPVVAGAVFGTQPAVSVEDTYGNVVTSDTSTVTATVGTGTGPLTGTLTAVAASGLATFSGLAAPTLAQTGLKLTFTDGSLTSVADATSITVSPGTVDHFVISAISSPRTAGTAITGVTITAQDVNNNTATSFTTTVVYSGTAGVTGTSPAFTAGVLSGHSITPTIAGSSLTVIVTGLTKTGTATITTINPGVATKLVMKTEPSSSVTVGTVFATPPAVYVEDANGNVVTGNGSTMTATVGTGTGPLTGTLTAVAASGVATFSGLAAPALAQTGLKLTFTDTGLTSVADTTSITVTSLLWDGDLSAAWDINTAANWQPSAKYLDGDSVQFDDTAAGPNFNVTLAGAVSPGSVVVNNSVNDYGLSGSGSINGTGGLTKQGTGTLTIATTNGYTGTTAIQGGIVQISSTNNLGAGHTLTFTGGELESLANNYNLAQAITVNTAGGATIAADSGTLTLTNVMSGAGALTNIGSGTVALANALNSYSGGTTINGGTVSIGADADLGNTAGGLIFAGGGTLQTTGSSAVTTARTVTLNSGGGVLNLGVPYYLNGTTIGGGGLTTSGNDLIIDRATGNNAIGAITVGSGRLFVFNTNSIGGSAISVQNGATIDFDNAVLNTIPVNQITLASGAAIANRLGTLSLSTNYVTFPSAGTIIFNYDDQSSTNIFVSGVYPVLTGNLSIQIGGISALVGTVTLSNLFSGGYGITKTLGGTLVLNDSVANTYSGGTTVSAGLLVVTNGSTLGSGNVSVAQGAVLNLDTATTIIAATASLSIVNSAGTLVVSNGFSGTDTITTLTTNGLRVAAGTWGGTGSTATHKSALFGGTGLINVQIGADSAYKIVATSSTPTAGASDALTIELVDASGTVDTTYSGSIPLTFSGLANSPSANVPTVGGVNLGTATTLSFVNGVATAPLIAYDAQTATLAATDGTLATTSTGGSGASLTVAPTTSSQLVMKTEPSATVAAGAALATQPAIYVEDTYGNVVTGNSSTVTATVGTGTGPLTGTLTAVAASGVATFSGLAAPTLVQAGLKLTFTDSGLTSVADTTSITVNPATAAKLVMKTEPSSSVTAGAVFAAQPAVYVEDQYGNVVTGNSSTVTATVGTGTGPLTGTLTAVAASGVATFSGLAAPTLAQTGLKLTFTDSGLTSVADTTSITVNPAPVAATCHVNRTAGLNTFIFWSNVATNWTDGTAGYTVSLQSLNATTTNGVTVATDGTVIHYPSSAANLNDQISYIVSDGHGGTNSGVINVVVNPFAYGQTSGSLTATGGVINITFYGIPTYSYQVQRSTDLITWANFSTPVTVGSTGSFIVTDSSPPSPAYYRLAWQP